jgi:hypothetical protein
MIRQGWLVTAIALGLAACSSPAPESPAKNQPATAPAKPIDQSRRFPIENQVKIQLVDDHVLGKDFLPGGNVAEYQQKGKTYQQFLVRAKSPEDAALLLFEFKGRLRDAKYLPHMGGYFGMDGDQPVYIFSKGAFLAGFAGLPEKQADPLARQFAARLN